MSKKKAPKPTAEQQQIQRQQLIQLTELDDDENRRRKQLLSNAAGIRAFKGSALTRAAPSNSAGGTRTPAFAAPRSSGAGASNGGSPISVSSGRMFNARTSAF